MRMEKNEYIQRETTSYLYLHFKTKQEQDPITSKHFEMIVGGEEKQKVKENCPRLCERNCFLNFDF